MNVPEYTETKSKLSIFGWISRIVFCIWQILMIIWFIDSILLIAPAVEAGGAEGAGAAIGGTIGIGLIFFFWGSGTLIFGSFVLLTRRTKSMVITYNNNRDMAQKTTKVQWSVSAVDYGRNLRGFSINLLVADVETSKKFAKDVLLAKVVYWNEDFAVIRQGNAEWMLHADHSYSDNAYLGIAQSGIEQSQQGRGAGAELRLYDLDPDQADRDTAWFSILDCEWEQAKAGFEKWLSLENFDAHGKQKRRLCTK